MLHAKIQVDSVQNWLHDRGMEWTKECVEAVFAEIEKMQVLTNTYLRHTHIYIYIYALLGTLNSIRLYTWN